MTHISLWERLPDALARVVAATGASNKAAQADICHAIADGIVGFWAELGRHASRSTTSRGTVLEGKAFRFINGLNPEDLDWQESRPLKPWLVRREAFKPHGFWHLERVELSRADVTNVLCGASVQSASAQPSSDEPRTTKPHRPGTAEISRLKAEETQNPSLLRPGRRRGRRPVKREATKEAMRENIRAGRITADGLADMQEKNLEADYGVSRDTARKARDAVLSEMSEQNSRQKPTNDN